MLISVAQWSRLTHEATLVAYPLSTASIISDIHSLPQVFFPPPSATMADLKCSLCSLPMAPLSQDPPSPSQELGSPTILPHPVLCASLRADSLALPCLDPLSRFNTVPWKHLVLSPPGQFIEDKELGPVPFSMPTGLENSPEASSHGGLGDRASRALGLGDVVLHCGSG